jgi:hypothetical protein
MTSQIFKNRIPNEIIFKLLNLLCIKNNDCFVFNISSFKKGVYDNEIFNFFKECSPYYHTSKRIYLDKKITYKSFTTVLRQICKYNKILFTTEIKYDKSIYDIIYYIYSNKVDE